MAVLGVTALAACDKRFSGGSTAGPPRHAEPGMDVINAIPLGDVAGAAESTLATQVPNPYSGNAQAVREGHDLYIRMNCAGCHGYTAKGGMGPNLTDGYWRYGGVPVALFKSIYEGRPQGMPAWNPALPPQEIWKIVAYLESLGGTYPANAFQASIQGDRPGQNVPAEVKATLPAGAGATSGPKPEGASTTPPSVAPNPDVKPPPGTGP
ncbi:MAG: c-type cytochrome [Pseudomonadota bacterium]|nr:c-type cytochrome [Pseudomonadota bacterium]